MIINTKRNIRRIIRAIRHGEDDITVCKSIKFRSGFGVALKNPIDLAGISGYNGFEVIYLSGMAFAFPANIQQEVYGCGHRNKECGECGGQRCTVR